MNIFVVNTDPILAAQQLCDKHINKMCIETAQLLCTAFHLHSVEADVPYKAAHIHNPITKWVAASSANFEWTLAHGFALYTEFQFRFRKPEHGNKPPHKSGKIMEWVRDHKHLIMFENTELTPFYQAVGEHKDPNPVVAYRNYYKTKTFAKWEKGREAPDWWATCQ